MDFMTELMGDPIIAQALKRRGMLPGMVGPLQDGSMPAQDQQAAEPDPYQETPDNGPPAQFAPPQAPPQGGPMQGPQGPPQQGFGARLKAALPNMITAGIAGAATPNIAHGGATDVFRAMQAGQGAVQRRDLLAYQQARQRQQDEMIRQYHQAQMEELAGRVEREKAQAARQEALSRMPAKAPRHIMPNGDMVDDDGKLIYSGPRPTPEPKPTPAEIATQKVREYATYFGVDSKLPIDQQFKALPPHVQAAITGSKPDNPPPADRPTLPSLAVQAASSNPAISGPANAALKILKEQHPRAPVDPNLAFMRELNVQKLQADEFAKIDASKEKGLQSAAQYDQEAMKKLPPQVASELTLQRFTSQDGKPPAPLSAAAQAALNGIKAESQRRKQAVYDHYSNDVRHRGGTAPDFAVGVDGSVAQKNDPYGLSAPAARPTSKPSVGSNSGHPAAPGKRVRVVDPNGNEGTIPESQLAEALAKGYRQ